MEILHPVQGAGDEKAAHLAAAEIVDQRVPVVMEALARVGMLVECRAVEMGEAVRIGREVGRDPVDQNADAGGVAGIDEAAEALGRAEPAAGGEHPDRLIAPRAAERVLHDRHQLDMGEAHLGDVGDQALGELVPVQGHAAVVGAQPGSGMDLVGRHRRVGRLALPAGRHPGGVGPAQGMRVGHDRGGGRRGLGRLGQGIALLRQDLAVGADQLVLVALTRLQARYEQFPHPGLDPLAHQVPAAVPDVEIADHRAAARVRRPDGEADAGHAVDRHRLRTEAPGQLPMPPLGDQIEVEFAQEQAEGVRVLGLLHAARPSDAQDVGRVAGEQAHEQPELLARLQGGEERPVGAGDGLDGEGTRHVDAHDRAGTGLVWAQERERVADPPLGQGLGCRRVDEQRLVRPRHDITH